MAAAISSLTAIGDRRAATNATSLRRVVRFTVPPPQPQGDVCAARDLAFVSPDRTRLVWVFSDPQSATQLACNRSIRMRRALLPALRTHDLRSGRSTAVRSAPSRTDT
jgi:hypothetical protein